MAQLGQPTRPPDRPTRPNLQAGPLPLLIPPPGETHSATDTTPPKISPPPSPPDWIGIDRRRSPDAAPRPELASPDLPHWSSSTPSPDPAALPRPRSPFLDSSLDSIWTARRSQRRHALLPEDLVARRRSTVAASPPPRRLQRASPTPLLCNAGEGRALLLPLPRAPRPRPRDRRRARPLRPLVALARPCRSSRRPPSVASSVARSTPLGSPATAPDRRFTAGSAPLRPRPRPGHRSRRLRPSPAPPRSSPVTLQPSSSHATAPTRCASARSFERAQACADPCPVRTFR